MREEGVKRQVVFSPRVLQVVPYPSSTSRKLSNSRVPGGGILNGVVSRHMTCIDLQYKSYSPSISFR